MTRMFLVTPVAINNPKETMMSQGKKSDCLSHKSSRPERDRSHCDYMIQVFIKFVRTTMHKKESAFWAQVFLIF
jgi:hypothetical protein